MGDPMVWVETQVKYPNNPTMFYAVGEEGPSYWVL